MDPTRMYRNCTWFSCPTPTFIGMEPVQHAFLFVSWLAYASYDNGDLGVPQLPGQGFSFHSFRTYTCKLNFMESPSGMKIILVIHPRTSDLREPLKYIYNLYVEHVVKNPLYSWISHSVNGCIPPCLTSTTYTLKMQLKTDGEPVLPNFSELLSDNEFLLPNTWIALF